MAMPTYAQIMNEVDLESSQELFRFRGARQPSRWPGKPVGDDSRIENIWIKIKGDHMNFISISVKPSGQLPGPLFKSAVPRVEPVEDERQAGHLNSCP